MVSGQTEGVWVVSGMGGWVDSWNGWMGGFAKVNNVCSELGGLGMGGFIHGYRNGVQ